MNGGHFGKILLSVHKTKTWIFWNTNKWRALCCPYTAFFPPKVSLIACNFFRFVLVLCQFYQNFHSLFNKAWIFSRKYSWENLILMLVFTIMFCFRYFREGEYWLHECFQIFISWPSSVQFKFLWETNSWKPWKTSCCSFTGCHFTLSVFSVNSSIGAYNRGLHLSEVLV